MPLFSTPTQFAALGLVLIAGWLLAHAALHPGDRRLLARPERFAAAVHREGPDAWERAARWLARTERPA